MTAPAWSVNQLAARAVALNAIDGDGRPLRDRLADTLDTFDKADARELLDILGLIDGPFGQHVLPDDTRNYDLDEASPEKGNSISLLRAPRQQRRRRKTQGAA